MFACRRAAAIAEHRRIMRSCIARARCDAACAGRIAERRVAVFVAVFIVVLQCATFAGVHLDSRITNVSEQPMAEYQKHLYMIVFPINALVSSQLPPEEFARHYTIGSPRHFEGKVIFAELDIAFRDPYFHIDEYLEKTVPHPDGAPKRTKFISSYRVLEHVPFSAIKHLYLVTTNGHALELHAAPYTAENVPGLIRIYQEIAPLGNLVASRLDQRAFGRYVTIESRAKGAPRVCFTQITLNIEEFLATTRNRDIISSPLPDNNPYHLVDCLMELQNDPDKKVKTISLSSVLREIYFRLLRHGFWFFDEGGNSLFYPFPSLDDLEGKYFDWWKQVR
ncbi:MAG: hypothetical protein IPP94_06540 [Ignavibacteria bacterium]|nr:hypothetical protein [Ignavibacteria bacterium]